MATGTIKSNALTGITIDNTSGTKISISGGTYQTGNIKIYYNNDFASIVYRLAFSDMTASRPVITVTEFPTNIGLFSFDGGVTLARPSSGSAYATDNSFMEHNSGASTASIKFRNTIGTFPTGTGTWLVLQGSFVAPVI